MEIFGTLAAILTSMSFIPQAVKTIKTQNTEGLSLVMYACFTTGVFMWVIYAFSTQDRPVFLANVVTLFFTVIILSIIVKNKLSEKKVSKAKLD